VRGSDFFHEIVHGDVPWGERSISVPVFYYDLMAINSYFLAPTHAIRSSLPSKRMYPLRLSPWHSVISISAFEYRHSDIGPYNEVMIGIPVTIDRPSPMFTGVLRRTPEVPKIYIRHLPVTTEIAYAAGVEFGAFPKILANIDFENDSEWVSCRLSVDSTHILTIKGRKGKLSQTPRAYAHILNIRNSRILRCEVILNKCESYSSKKPSDVDLELGNHPIADELRSIGLGRMMGYQYTPHQQAILTPIVESFAL
jgi:hypothetical protein